MTDVTLPTIAMWSQNDLHYGVWPHKRPERNAARSLWILLSQSYLRLIVNTTKGSEDCHKSMIPSIKPSLVWNVLVYVEWKVYCLFDRIKTLVMFDEENKTKTCKKVKSHKKSNFGHFIK